MSNSINLVPDPALVVLVGVDFGDPHFDAELRELGQLAQSGGYLVADRVVCRRRAPHPALFVGSGKAQEIKLLVQSTGAKEVFFDQALSPGQQRNLEKYLSCPVNDRTLLILGIFAKRACSHEGKLQVELAQLQYLSTRLVRRWTHLERQSGGIGMRGGPGEKQIELDKRVISEAVKRIKSKLSKLKIQRSTQRRQRYRRDTFNISLVGYTNAGKSSLFNALAKTNTYQADQLFATLDTITRYIHLENITRSVSLSDTVGFIQNLPHELIEAFSTTLQETVDADLLLHVVDASNPNYLDQISAVMTVLRDIGANHVPQILVFNKLDRMGLESAPYYLQHNLQIGDESIPRIYVSALDGRGLPELRASLVHHIGTQSAAFDNNSLDYASK